MITAYDDATHTYTYDGRVVPSVTQVLASVGYGPKPWHDASSRDRGTIVHWATACDDRGELAADYAIHYPWLEPYVSAWRQFRAAMVRLPFTAIERQLYQRDNAGTVDRAATLVDGLRYIIDIKTGSPEPWHRLQTAGYWLLARQPGTKRACVYLSDDAKYRFERHEDNADIYAYEGALKMTIWRINNERELPWKQTS